MKILITGSSGHLGEAIIRKLLENNQQFIGIDLKPSSYTNRLGSITDRRFVKQCFKDVNVVIHTATLHKPHVATHTHQDFIDVNLKGTLALLEEAKRNGVQSFIYTSTSSTFGDVLFPEKSEPSIWITENSPSSPKNIYGVTKSAAEDLCQLFYRNHGLPCVILKTSRFFPEEDDKKAIRDSYQDANIKANELLYRRVDLEDAVDAHLLAIKKTPEVGFGKYIISASTPFTQTDLSDLRANAPKVVEKIYPEYSNIYHNKGWKMFSSIDRVYVNQKAKTELGWKPKYDFNHVLNCLKEDNDFRSQLSIQVGIKGYHSQTFEDGPYPVNET